MVHDIVRANCQKNQEGDFWIKRAERLSQLESNHIQMQVLIKDLKDILTEDADKMNPADLKHFINQFETKRKESALIKREIDELKDDVTELVDLT